MYLDGGIHIAGLAWCIGYLFEHVIFWTDVFIIYLKQKKATECLSVAFTGSIQIRIV